MPGLRASWSVLLTCVVSVLVFAGCGGPHLPNPVEISGKITMDGKPLPDVNVIFHCVKDELPAEARTSQAKTDAEGKYKMPKCYPANYTVGIEAPPPAQAADPGMMTATPATTPLSKYNLANSKLKVDIAEPRSDVDFDLTSK